MNYTPLISIALCTYNGQLYLEQQLVSLIHQSYKHIEIIIVDDCSSDLTPDILAKYEAAHSFIKVYVNSSRLGYNKNFETALRLCTGDLIAICDQDDIWNKDKLEIQQKALKDHVLVYCDSQFIDRTGKSMNYKMSDKFNFYKGSEPEAFLFANCVSGHTILLKKGLLSFALPFPADYHYDQWLAFTACCIGSIDFVNECLVLYRIHDGNCTDVLALKKEDFNKKNDVSKKLFLESNWLKLCSSMKSSSQPLIRTLYKHSVVRNVSFSHLPYGLTIWKNRSLLLHILIKNDLSRFFFVIRKIWGLKMKRLFSGQ